MKVYGRSSAIRTIHMSGRPYPVTARRPVSRTRRRSASGVAAGGISQHQILGVGGDHLPLRPVRAPRILARRHRADAVAHDAPEHDHAAVRRGEMLERVDRDRALARLRVVVRGEALARVVGPVLGLPEAGPRDLLGREPPRGIHLGQLEVRGVRVVVGHRPADDHRPARRLGRGRLLDLARELVHVRRHEVTDAHPDEIMHATGRDVDHARVGGDPVELGHHAEGFGELIAARERVQERGVHRVHAVVLHLEPVARQRELGRGHERVARHIEACRRAETRAPGRAGPDTRRRARRTRAWDTRPATRARTGGCPRARPASRDSARPRRTPSRGSSSAGRARAEWRTRATCRDARSAGGARRRARRDRGRPRDLRPGCARGAAGRPDRA